MDYRSFHENGYIVFGLHPILDNGMCGCLNPQCTAQGKHPISSGWQNTPLFDEEQLECGEMIGQFDTGYGILCNGLIVIDVDERNGGADSYAKLLADVPEISEAGLIVKSGSGGASRHIFFKAPEGVQLNSHLSKYHGIDLKVSGFIVGSGSLHKSGNRYEIVYGSPDDIGYAPESLVNLLKKESKLHVSTNTDVSHEELINMLNCIDNTTMSHDEWVKVGMAIHHATNGDGYNLWCEWSKKSPKSTGKSWERKWHSFGKSPNPATIGTLVYLAEQGGYTNIISNVTFESNVDFGDIDEEQSIINHSFDFGNPPGLCGRIVKWINSRSMYPRENLAVAASLMLISSCGGMRHRGTDGISGNLFLFCVAGSGTGKENILQSYTQIMREVGLTPAVHGAIKSEQEIARNIVQHQGAFYALDEFGELLAKIQGARKKSGNASYLEGIVGALMSIYSKANGIHLISNDLRRSVLKELQTESNALNKAIEENEDKTGIKSQRLESLKTQILNMETGIINPYLNILGFTAPTRFTGLLDEDLADNGFMARALIIREMDDNPRYSKEFKMISPEQDEEFKQLSAILSNMYHGGHSSSGRVERMGEIVNIPTGKKCHTLLEQIREYFWELGETQKERQGFVAYTRRGYEMVNRISLVLSMGEHEISEDAIMWAFEFVKRDMTDKITMTNANTTLDKGDALISKILSLLDTTHGISLAIIKNKIKNYKAEVIQSALDHMLSNNMIISKDIKPVRGPISTKYFKIA